LFTLEWTHPAIQAILPIILSAAVRSARLYTRSLVNGDYTHIFFSWTIMDTTLVVTDSNWKSIDHVLPFERTSSVTECHTWTHFTVTRGWSRESVNLQEAPRCLQRVGNLKPKLSSPTSTS